MYRLMDSYTLFYFKFVKNNAGGDRSFWSNSLEAPFRVAWLGFAFERLCILHVEQIKKALGISGVRTEISSWRHRADREVPRGVQIDLLIDRKDDIVNLCEMKFCHGKFLITKKYDKELAMKQQVFKSVTGTRKSVHLTLVTAEGVERNSYSDNISSEVTLDDLFKE